MYRRFCLTLQFPTSPFRGPWRRGSLMADVERDEREEKLKAVLFREEQAARQWQQGDLTEVRELSLAYYDRAPTGDEVEGQSRIVTSEYADTVESIMPALMRVFASGEDIVRFTP